ncbi:hypothetical protein BKA70DRAFT_797129 [Coprinopsis sp. MPI-PUGE-AT-0042]|nr:hypothetical protein BKA70DRAFT_797129 [Coprinopsis sp. MPI-PUGE-AT-0042]
MALQVLPKAHRWLIARQRFARSLLRAGKQQMRPLGGPTWVGGLEVRARDPQMEMGLMRRMFPQPPLPRLPPLPLLSGSSSISATAAAADAALSRSRSQVSPTSTDNKTSGDQQQQSPSTATVENAIVVGSTDVEGEFASLGSHLLFRGFD